MDHFGAALATVAPSGAGRYAAAIDPVWNLRPLPQGGIVTALALRAAALELDAPLQVPRSLHTTFVGQVAHGPVEIDVEVLRRGRSVSHLRIEVRNPGAAAGHVTTCAFGAARDGFEFTDLRPPVGVPPPSACRSFREPPPDGWPSPPPMPFWTDVVEGRLAAGHLPWERYEPASSQRALWYRFDRPPRTDVGDLDPLSLVVLLDTMPGAVGERTGGSGEARPWFSPSIDLTVHLLGRARSTWLLAQNSARFAGDGYASVDLALWDCGEDGADEPHLAAYATQVCFFTFLD